MAHSKKSIYSALIANFLIAIVKFVAGAMSGSAGMRAEGVHSLVDTMNEVLLLYGIRQSRKPPDERRPFGYGKELYFWSFIVSILIFAVGGGISIYQGIVHLLEPEPMGSLVWNYAVLLIALGLDGASFFIAIREFNQRRGRTGWWQAVVGSKDPTSFVVLFEDAADVLGILIVLACTFLADVYGWHWLDGLGSLLVGLLLVGISLILARESRGLLMGEGLDSETKEHVRSLALQEASIVAVKNILSNYQAPETVVLMLQVVFREELQTNDINNAVARLREAIKAQFPIIRYVLIQPEHALSETEADKPEENR